jgi:hypothetical protein
VAAFNPRSGDFSPVFEFKSRFREISPVPGFKSRTQCTDDWQGEVIVVERLRQELTAMFVSRRPKVIQLAETVTMTRDASVEIITETLGDPGRAR